MEFKYIQFNKQILCTTHVSDTNKTEKIYCLFILIIIAK